MSKSGQGAISAALAARIDAETGEKCLTKLISGDAGGEGNRSFPLDFHRQESVTELVR